MSDFSEELGEALRRIGPKTNQSGWRAELADRLKKAGCDVSESTVARWWYGNQEISGDNLMALFRDPVVGGFLRRVLFPDGGGEPETVADALDIMEADLRTLRRLSESDVVQLPMRGKAT